jgi:RHS repeat-associated protein
MKKNDLTGFEMKHQKKLNILLYIFIALACIVSGIFNIYKSHASFPHAQDGFGQYLKAGVVAAKGVIKGDNGNPIWVEFDNNGDVVREIGEAYQEPLEKAWVMGADTFRQYKKVFLNIQETYQDNYEVLYDYEYYATKFMLVNQEEIISPPLKNDTVSVVIRKSIYQANDFILFECPLDLKSSLDLSDSSRSILLSEKGEILDTSDVNIGYRTAFYTTETNDHKKGASTLYGFQFGKDKLWAPIAGANVSLIYGAADNTDERGTYKLEYFLPPCPGFPLPYPYIMILELPYINFNPKSDNIGKYYDWREGLDFCIGGFDLVSAALTPGLIGAAAQMSSGVSMGNALYGEILNVESQSIDATWYRYNFPVDIAMLSGLAFLENTPRAPILAAISGQIPLEDETKYIISNIGNILMDQGLLVQISPQDIRNTDIYVFRQSNNQLINVRQGLDSGETHAHYSADLVTEYDSIIRYNILMRGPDSYHPVDWYYLNVDRGSIEQWQAKTNVNPELRGKKADHLRMGEKVNVIIVNRATGYMGSSVVEVQYIDDDDPEKAPLISFSPPVIVLHPPNLKIRAERKFKVEKGLTINEERTNVIGTEGSGLTSDQYIAIITEWVDWNDKPLPDALPGFTARLARIFQNSKLNEIAQFEIKPGTRTQIVQLPQKGIDNAHFYVHVNGNPPDRNPDFSIADDDDGIFMNRPKKNVPIKAPIFNKDTTSINAAGQAYEHDQDWSPGKPSPIIENIEKKYDWVYRPEYQFSLFDLEIKEIEFTTEFDLINGFETDMELTYNLSTYDNIDPLQRLSDERKLIFGVGYAGLLTLLGDDQSLIFENLNYLSNMLPAYKRAFHNETLSKTLEPEDYLGLQLYQEDDAGNGLFEYFGIPLIYTNTKPFTLKRVYLLSQFDGDPTGDLNVRDDYHSFEIHVIQQSNVRVDLLDKEKHLLKSIIFETELHQGKYVFFIDYETVKNAGINPDQDPFFNVHLKATSVTDNSVKQNIYYPGALIEKHDGNMLGQVIVHDVLIQDGSLNLSRKDVELKGRGPKLMFSRSYNNQAPGYDDLPLGPYWNHNFNRKLIPLSTSDGSIPKWVEDFSGKFVHPDEIPKVRETWKTVIANGTVFKKKDNVWIPQKGRHGSLIETLNEFIYVSKDGTRYYYNYPTRYVAYPTKDNTPAYMRVGDSITTRIGLSPEVLKLSKSNPISSSPSPGQPARPEPLRYIEDRNDNRMTFSYDSMERLIKIEDAVKREFTFEYQLIETAIDDGSHYRLIQLVGPDGIVIELSYYENGLLKSVKRDQKIEHYTYQSQPAMNGLEFDLIKVTDSNNKYYTYQYHEPDEIDSSIYTIVKGLKSQEIVKKVCYPDGHCATFQYNATDENKRIVSDLKGSNTKYILNFFGNPLSIDEPLGKKTQMTWSINEGKPDNVMTSKTDMNGKTSYEYDAKGNITKETDPLGNSIITSWNQEYSLPLSKTDRNGVTQKWEYDSKGNLQNYTDGDNNKFSYSCNSTGEIKSKTFPKGGTIQYSYDNFGNPLSVEEPEGSTTKYHYDIRGRITKTTDPNGNSTSFDYNNLDYQIKIIHPPITKYPPPSNLTNIQSFDYDAEGNLLSENDRMRLKLTYSYTDRYQVNSIGRNIGGKKSFSYDPNGNLKEETDWKGQTITHEYNALNQRTSTTNRLGHSMSMEYDKLGNMIEKTDYAGTKTTYKYDKLNRLTTETLTGDTGGTIKYSYYKEADPEKNLKTITDQEDNKTTFSYNGRYLKTSRKNALGGLFQWTYDNNGNLKKEIDEEQKEIDNICDLQNRLITKITPCGIEEYGYDFNGNRTSFKDRNGNKTFFYFDEWNREYSKTDPKGNSTQTEYDGGDNVVKTIDANSNTRSWSRDSRGLVTQYTDAESNGTSYIFDLNANVIKITNPRGMITTNTYDAEDRLKSTTEVGKGSRKKEVKERDNMGNPKIETDFKGNETKTEYNALYLPKTITDAKGNPTHLTYYKTGQKKTEKNRRNYSTSYVIDPLGRVTNVNDPKGQTIITSYDKVGNVKTIQDKRGIVTSYDYDDCYRKTIATRSGIKIETNEYDNMGNLRFFTDAEDNTTEYIYDSTNLLEQTIYPDGTTQKRTYDPVGNMMTLEDEEGKFTTYTYDKENRMKSSEFAGEKTRYNYDSVGNQTAIIRPKNNGRTMNYDLFNRLESVTEGNLTTQYEYDNNDNLTKQEEPNGNLVSYVYDALNLKEKQTNSSFTTTYGYDEEKNLTSMTDPNGQTFSYGYDELNRQILKTYGSDTSPYIQITRIDFGYDGNNNLTQISETKNGITDETINTYDELDRLKTSTQRGLAIEYDYDNNGNKTSISTPDKSTTYDYDSRNRVKSIIESNGTSTITYYPDGKKKAVQYPNGTTSEYNYYQSNRVQSISHKTSSSTISHFNYSYDSNGNRTSLVEEYKDITKTTTYDYDNIDRLTAYHVDDGTDIIDTSYTFENYNRKTETIKKNSIIIQNRTFNYDQTNRLLNIEESNEDKPTKTITFTYDKNGNTLSKNDSEKPNEILTFTYNSRDQLVQLTRGPPDNYTILGQYDYNASGMRVRHRYSSRGDINYFYDDNAVIEEQDDTTGNTLAHYHYADRLISMETENSTQYYHHDALGSTVNLTNKDGDVQVTYQLDPWGKIEKQIGESENRQVFTGQEHDEKSDLIYFGARYYDSDIGRFTCQDHYPGEITTPPSLHRYLYAYSNPTVYVDLYGFESIRELMGLDEESVDEYLSSPGNANVKALVLTTKDTFYKAWEGVTGGFLSRQDKRQEMHDSGKLSEKEFWSATGFDTFISTSSQFIGGAISGKISNKLLSSTGSKLVGTVLGEAAGSGSESLLQQSGQVLTSLATDGKLGQKEIDYQKVISDAATGFAFSGIMHGAGNLSSSVYNKIKSKLGSKVKKKIQPHMTVENRAGSSNASKKPIVIGENMKRVQQYADDIGGHAYRPWKNDPFDYNLGMKRNKRWIQDMKREGREVIDIGPDFKRRSLGKDPSDFYNMERSQLKGYDNYNKVFERTGKNSGGVPGLDF